MKSYRVTRELLRLYKTEDLSGEVSDEVLFGTSVEILHEDGTVGLCRTEYGYCGYANLWEVKESSGFTIDENERMVFRRCDLLCSPSFSSVPYMSLPAGARVSVTGEYDKRFIEVGFRGRSFYVHRNAFRGFNGDVCRAARSFLGVPYRWGGRTHRGIDCSGFVFTAFSLCGVPFHRDSAYCPQYSEMIDGDEAEAGDVAYLDGHIALLLSKTEIIHSSASLGYVVRSRLDRGLVKYYGRAKNKV